MEKVQAFEKALSHLKEETDTLEGKIQNIKQEMDSIKTVVQKYNDLGQEKKKLAQAKKEKSKLPAMLMFFYKDATGEEPDCVYPLFSQNNQADTIQPN